MRIVHLANHAENLGNGIVNMMVDLACSQARAGHEVTVATSGGDFEDLLVQHGVQLFRLPQSKKPWLVPAMLLGFRRLLRESRPDIVHAHMMTGVLIGRFGALARDYALITTVHNEFQRSASLMGLGDRVVCVTNEVAKSMAARGIRQSKIDVVRNGTIGTPRRPTLDLPASPRLQRPAIVTVAGMYERKGIRELLRAFASVAESLPDAQLYLVGDGPDKDAMQAYARELNIDTRAHFAGFVADPRAHLREADVFVLASHKEPGALVLVEAREAGCAIIATDVDGNPEMLDFGEAGMLVPPKNPDMLADAMSRMLSDPALLDGYRRRSGSSIGHFRVESVCDNYVSVYRQALVELGRQFADAPGSSMS